MFGSMMSMSSVDMGWSSFPAQDPSLRIPDGSLQRITLHLSCLRLGVLCASLYDRDWRKTLGAAAAASVPVGAQLLYARYFFGSFAGHGYGAEASQGWTAPWLLASALAHRE